jgi:prevent-host-death family protein
MVFGFALSGRSDKICDQPSVNIPQRYLKMKVWSVREARERFSEFLDACLRGGPQIVTRCGAEMAVLVPIDDWRRLQRSVRPTLKELLLSETPRAELQLRTHGRRRRLTPTAIA